MSLFQYLFLFSTAFLSGVLAFFFQEIPRHQIKIVMSFTGSFILGVTALHLLPDVFTVRHSAVGHWILAGFFVQLMLERLSKGIEHGHVHPRHAPERLFAAQVLLGLSVHSFLEGFPLGAYPSLSENMPHAHGRDGQAHLFWSIVLHEMPASFTLVTLLLLSNFSKLFVLFCLTIKCLMAPAGALLSDSMQVSPALSVQLTALVVGLFLHIATTILFEADHKDHQPIAWQRLVAIIVGLALAIYS